VFFCIYFTLGVYNSDLMFILVTIGKLIFIKKTKKKMKKKMKYLKAEKTQHCYACTCPILKNENYLFLSYQGFRTSLKVCEQCVKVN